MQAVNESHSHFFIDMPALITIILPTRIAVHADCDTLT